MSISGIISVRTFLFEDLRDRFLESSLLYDFCAI